MVTMCVVKQSMKSSEIIQVKAKEERVAAESPKPQTLNT